MRRLFFVLVSFFLLIATSNAGVDFRSGYIITLKYDTIFGKIANTNYYDHSQSCTFKDTKTNEVRIYSPAEIAGYRFIDGKYYVSKEIVIDNKPTLLFMEYLINGKLSFYFRQDNNKVNHYYASKDSVGITELEYSKQTVDHDGKSWEDENRKFQGLLSYLTYDCRNVSGDIRKMNEPDHKKLIKFGLRYHNLICSDKSCIVFERKIPPKIKLEVLGGIDNYFMSIISTNGSKGFYSLPSLGFNLLFQQSENSERIYLGLGMVVANTKHDLKEDLVLWRIPLSINYLDSKMGFSPTFSYAVDLNRFCLSQALRTGVKYQLKTCSLNLNAALHTMVFVLPYCAAVTTGVTFDLR